MSIAFAVASRINEQSTLDSKFRNACSVPLTNDMWRDVSQGFKFDPATIFSKFLRFEEDDWNLVEELLDKVLVKLADGKETFLDVAIMVAVTLSYSRDVKEKMKLILEICLEKMRAGVFFDGSGLLHCRLSLTGKKDQVWQVHAVATLMYLGWRLCCM